MENLPKGLRPGDVWVNDANGAWFRVTKVEETPRGEVVRFSFGVGASRKPRKKIGQHTHTRAEFELAMREFRLEPAAE